MLSIDRKMKLDVRGQTSDQSYIMLKMKEKYGIIKKEVRKKMQLMLE